MQKTGHPPEMGGGCLGLLFLTLIVKSPSSNRMEDLRGGEAFHRTLKKIEDVIPGDAGLKT